MHSATPTPHSLQEALQTERIWNAGITLLGLSAIVLVFSFSVADPDLWGHLRFGLDTLETGKIVSADPYSYLTAGQAWIRQDWLAEVLLAAAWQAAGSVGLILLKTLIGCLALGLIFKFLCQQTRPIRAALLMLPGLFLVSPAAASARPHLFTLLLFSLMALILIQAESGKYRTLWLLPPLFALWANLHGGFLMGLALFGLWAVVHWFTFRPAWGQILLPLLASTAATLINPYGVRLPVLLVRTLLTSFPEVTEWQPISLTSLLGLIYLFTLALGVAGLIFTRRERRLAPVILFSFMALMPFMAVRHVAIFPLAALVFTGEHILDAWDRFWPVRERSTKMPTPLSGVPALGAIILLVLAAPNFGRISMPKDFPYPVGAVTLIEQSGVRGNLATRVDWGFYVLWHLGPQVQVSVDGRQHFAYSDQVYRQNLQFTYGVGDWAALLEDYPTEMALVGKSFASYNLMLLNKDWVLVYEDPVSALFVKKSSPLLEPLQKAAAGFTAPEPPSGFPD